HTKAAVGLFLGFAALYLLSIGPNPPNIGRYNFVFDADPSRVISDALNGQDPVTYERHPLFGILVGLPSRVLAAAGLGNSVGLVVALLAAAGVAGAFALFRRITGENRAALMFAILYGSAASIWLLAAIPETFALNSALIVCLLLLLDPRSAD